MFTHHASGAHKRRRMRLAAAVAVAVADGHVQAVHLVAHGFAEATSIQRVSHNVLPDQGWGHRHRARTPRLLIGRCRLLSMEEVTYARIRSHRTKSPAQRSTQTGV